MPRPSLDQTFIEVAKILALRGTCMKMQVGCVMTDIKGRVLSTGWNGVHSGAKHCNEFRFEFKDWPNACNDGKPFLAGSDLCEAVHAEQNALLQCKDPDKIHTVYTTVSPCMRCVKELMNTSAQRIVFYVNYGQPQAEELWRRYGRDWIKI